MERKFPMDVGQKNKIMEKKCVRRCDSCFRRRNKGEAFVTADVGQHQMFVAQYYPFRKFRGHVSSGGLGSMGAGLPLAMGVQVAFPKKKYGLFREMVVFR